MQKEALSPPPLPPPGVHRNTISNWRRGDARFRYQWEQALFEQNLHWRDQMQSMGDLAADALRRVLTDERTPPSVLLKAALAVLNTLTTPVPAAPERSEERIRRESLQMLHNPAQSQDEENEVLSSKKVAYAAPAQSCTTPRPLTYREEAERETEEAQIEHEKHIAYLESLLPSNNSKASAIT